jgi:hypothetical protein
MPALRKEKEEIPAYRLAGLGHGIPVSPDANGCTGKVMFNVPRPVGLVPLALMNNSSWSADS